MRLVFCGTPAFAVPTFERLLGGEHRIALVVTQPDRPQGRGLTLVASPVKLAALARGLPVLQPEKIKNNAAFRAELEAIQPDAIIVVAYGRIIPKWMIDLPRFGNLNMHASLLPKYRGAAPIQWAIANGETTTGATTMRIDEGLDTGDMLLQRELPIEPDQTAEDLFPLLAQAGAELMIETLEGLEAGTLEARRQDESRATLAPILKREDGEIDFTHTASAIYNRWRGFQPWPGAYTLLNGKKLTVHRMSVAHVSFEEEGSSPGMARAEGNRLFVTCGGNTAIEILEVQLEGKKRLPVSQFLHGFQLVNPTRLG